MSDPHLNLFDVRLRRRLLAKGALDEKALEHHLETLPDVSGQAVTIDIQQPAVLGAAVDEEDEE